MPVPKAEIFFETVLTTFFEIIGHCLAQHSSARLTLALGDFIQLANIVHRNIYKESTHDDIMISYNDIMSILIEGLFVGLLLPHRVMEAVCPAGLHKLFGADHAEFAVGYVAGYRAARSHNRIAANLHGCDQG